MQISTSTVQTNFLTSFFFFFNDTPTPEISTLPLHDALPISIVSRSASLSRLATTTGSDGDTCRTRPSLAPACTTSSSSVRLLGVMPRARMSSVKELMVSSRSEEHTSELQSQSNLVCRLLLEQ